MTAQRNFPAVLLLLVLLVGIFNEDAAQITCSGKCVDGFCPAFYREEFVGSNGCLSGQRCCVEIFSSSGGFNCPGQCVAGDCYSAGRIDIGGNAGCSPRESCCVEA